MTVANSKNVRHKDACLVRSAISRTRAVTAARVMRRLPMRIRSVKSARCGEV